MPHMAMQHVTDPAKDLWDALTGHIDGVEAFNNKLILATYLRPEKTAGGLHLPDKYRDEDKYQSKVGLLIKMGGAAFDDTSGKWFSGVTFELGDWLLFRPADGWAMEINKVPCRMFDDVNIVGRVSHPDLVY